MYTDYWKLTIKPFENSPDPRFLYHSAQHDEALMRLLYAIQSSKGAGLLTGEYGCGKTLLMHTIVNELSSGQFDIAYLTNPRWSASELVQEILYQLEITADGTKRIEMLHSLNDFLFENVRNGKHTIIIVDEAQIIADYETFEELRLLLNFQLNDRCLLTLFLVGQPELKDIVKKIPQMNYPDASIEVSIKFLRTMSTGYDKPDDIPYPVLQHTFESLLHFHIDQRY